jgi:hypothetical protein
MEVREGESAFAEGGFVGDQRQRLSPTVAIEELIDDERHSNAFGLMMSLNMLIEFGDAFDFTGRDFDGWCRKIGFRGTEVIPLRGPASAAVAYK